MNFPLLKSVAKHQAWHYVGLIALMLLGAILRFLQLDSKPLWLDEVITAIFTLGRTYADVPLGSLFSIPTLEQIFTLQPGVSCAQIAGNVARESVHPPLFFCLMYRWLSWLQPSGDNWIWMLRALPAWFGVGAIATSYLLNRVAFSAKAGLMSAALMAVSPFAVYLSQEARHYTLPMMLITLSLVGLVMIQQDLDQHRPLRPWVWLGWVAINVLGLYVHYFCMLALVAQIVSLGSWMIWHHRRFSLHQFASVAIATVGIILCYLPWLPTLIGHFSRPETSWLKPFNPDALDRIAPLYQMMIGWVLMVITLPVEDQPLTLAIPLGFIMIGFTGWLVYQMIKGLRHLQWQGHAGASLWLIAGFTLTVLGQFLVIVYVLDKDITVVPRYNFVYYPGVCALLGASLASLPSKPLIKRIKAGSRYSYTQAGFLAIFPRVHQIQWTVVLVGMLSSLCVVHGLAFHKSYYPEKVSQTMYRGGTEPLMVVVNYKSLQEVALGLSFALQLQKYYTPATELSPVRFAFIEHSAPNRVWRNLAQLEQPLSLPLNLWVVASPGMRSRDYPDELALKNPSGNNNHTTCLIEPDEYHRIGFPYQLYRCQS